MNRSRLEIDSRTTTDLFRNHLTDEKLMILSQGHAAFQCLWAGLELGLYDLLARRPGLSRAHIVDALALEDRPTRVLLTALVSLGILMKSVDEYSLAPAAERRLVTSSPDYAGDTLGWQRHIVYPGLEDFTRSLRENKNTGLEKFPGQGDSLYARLRADPFKEKVFAKAMQGLSRQANTALLENADFSRFRHMVDLGGGIATNALAFAARYPHLRATVMDLPTVCRLAEPNIAAQGLTDRVKVHPGNLLEDPFPSNADLFLFSHLFSIWSEETDRRLMKKAFDALPAGGALALFGMAMDADERGPVGTALGNPYFLAVATGEGYLYSVGEYEAWLREAGFDSLRTVTGLPLDHVLIVAEKRG
jgi:hypothetical protein